MRTPVFMFVHSIYFLVHIWTVIIPSVRSCWLIVWLETPSLSPKCQAPLYLFYDIAMMQEFFFQSIDAYGLIKLLILGDKHVKTSVPWQKIWIWRQVKATMVSLECETKRGVAAVCMWHDLTLYLSLLQWNFKFHYKDNFSYELFPEVLITDHPLSCLFIIVVIKIRIVNSGK